MISPKRSNAGKLKQSSQAGQRLMPLHKQIALGKKPTAPKISNSPKKK